jgi:hypothetical protein
VANQTQIELTIEDGQVVGATSRVNAALQTIEDKAKHLGEHTGFDKFAESIKAGIEDPLHSAGDAIEGLLKGMGPMGQAAAAGATGILALGVAGFEAAKGLGEWATSIHDVELRTGLAAKEVGQFSFATKAVGSDISAVERLMRGLTMAVEGTDAKSAAARQTLKGMGVDLAGLRDGTASTSDTLLKISEGLNAMPNVWERNKAALDLFKRSGIDAIPVMLELSENIKRAKELGFGPSEEEVTKLKAYTVQMAEVSTIWDAFVRKVIKEPLAVPVMFLLKGFVSGWAGYNKAQGNFNASLDNADQESLDRQYGTNPGGANYLNLGAGLSAMGPLPASGAYATGMFNLADSQKGQAAIGRDQAANLHTLAGAEAALKDATKDAQAAQDEYFGKKGTDAPSADVLRLRDAWIEAKEAVTKYTAEVKAFKGKKGEGDLKLPAGYADADYAFHRSIIPSLYGPEMAGLNYSDMAYGDLSSTISAGRSTGNLSLYQGMGGTVNRQFDQQQSMKKAGVDFEAQVLQLTLSESDAVEKIYKLRLSTASTQEDIQKAELAHDMTVLQLRQKANEEATKAADAEADAFGKLVVDFSNAAETGGHRGISQFFRGQAHSLADTLIGNVSKTAFSSFISSAVPQIPGPFGDLLPSAFRAKAADPSLKLSSAGESLLKAGIDLSAAARALATSRTGGGGALVPGGGGGSSDPFGIMAPFNGNMGSLTYGLSGDGSGSSADLTGNAWGSVGSASSGTAAFSPAALVSLGASPAVATQLSGMMALSAKLKTMGTAAGGFMGDVSSGMSDPLGILFGKDVSQGGNYTGTATVGQDVGAGVGIAAAGMGTYMGLAQIARGGGHNVAAGIGTSLMSVGGFMATTVGGAPAAPFVIGAGLAAEMVGLLMGDPRVARGRTMSNFEMGAAYSGPDPVSYARSMSGGTVGTDMFGNSRAVGNTTNVTIHAMDPDSFNTFLQNHPTQLDNGIYNVIQNGSKSVPALRQTLLGG